MHHPLTFFLKRANFTTATTLKLNVVSKRKKNQMLYNKLEKNWKNKFVVQQKNNIRKKLKNVVQHWNFFKRLDNIQRMATRILIQTFEEL